MNWLLGDAEAEQPAAGNGAAGAPKKAASAASAASAPAPAAEGERADKEPERADKEPEHPRKEQARAEKAAPEPVRIGLRGIAARDERAVQTLLEHVTRAVEAVPRVEAAVQPLVGMLQAIAKAAARSDQDRKQQALDLRAHITGEMDRLAEVLRDQIAAEAAIEVWRGLTPALDEIDHVLREAALGEVKGVDSVRLVRRKLRDSLSRLGIEEIAVEEGVTQFDAEHHEGQPHEGDAAGLAAGTVVRLERTGYVTGERVLRCALVTVAKGARG